MNRRTFHRVVAASALLALASCGNPGGVDKGGANSTTNGENHDPDCGNGVIDEQETCDGDQLDGATCMSEVNASGVLGCAADCRSFDLAACEAPATCGNDELDGGETCDGTQLSGATCSSEGQGTGELGCLGNCLAYDFSGCDVDSTCGNGMPDGDETCDPGMQAVPCSELGFDLGTAACLSDCSGYDESSCSRLGTGFDSDATKWSLPGEGGGEGGKWWTLNRSAFTAETYNWSTLDLNGDGLPDLVSPNRVNAEGTKEPHGWPDDPHWKVFLNDGTGFAASPTNWSLPGEGGGEGGKWWTLNRSSFTAETYNWSTLDLNGDGLPDLVSPNRVNAEGTKEPHGWPDDPHWKVFLNDGAGFAASPTKWSLPGEGGGEGGKWWTLNRSAFTAETYNWSTLDLNGDGLPDLVSPNRVNAEGTKEPHGWPDDPHWKVFLNDGAGFAASPTKWSLPGEGGGEGGKWWTLNRSAFTAETYNWSTLDLNGDGLSDLVSPNRVNAEGTKEPHGWPDDPHWKVFLNDGAGFAASPTKWSLPGEGGGEGGKWWTLNRSAFTAETYNWSTLDLDGDGLPDLVSPNRVNAEGTKEPHGWPDDAHWLLFRNTGDGFEAAGTRWTLPGEGGGEGGKWWTLNRSAFTAETYNWSTLDLDGDGRPDLVSPNRVNAEGTKEPHGWPDDPHWRVFRNVP